MVELELEAHGVLGRVGNMALSNMAIEHQKYSSGGDGGGSGQEASRRQCHQRPVLISMSDAICSSFLETVCDAGQSHSRELLQFKDVLEIELSPIPPPTFFS